MDVLFVIHVHDLFRFQTRVDFYFIILFLNIV